MECYKFTFKYRDEEKIKILPTSKQVIAKSQEVLNSINSLSDYKKLPDNIQFDIELIYHNSLFTGLSNGNINNLIINIF